jgi:hypothetical protein
MAGQRTTLKREVESWVEKKETAAVHYKETAV